MNVVLFHPNKKNLLIAALQSGTISILNYKKKRICRNLCGHKIWLLALDSSPDGKTLASGSGTIVKTEIKLWNLATFAEIKTLSGHGCRVYSLDFSPNGKTLVS